MIIRMDKARTKQYQTSSLLHGPHVADGLVHYTKLNDNIIVKSMF